eukprot:TRINITY_DN68099_c2_g4_i4.p1 TRINITY_DN68099_c2_g4~~TRINITY_DN68099_c2_g4_i4.p1  ORF type:complete len:353 (+),score=38.43 TRINITY_DN68099_c2_g4_i4:1428-2486(+)
MDHIFCLGCRAPPDWVKQNEQNMPFIRITYNDVGVAQAEEDEFDDNYLRAQIVDLARKHTKIPAHIACASNEDEWRTDPIGLLGVSVGHVSGKTGASVHAADADCPVLMRIIINQSENLSRQAMVDLVNGMAVDCSSVFKQKVASGLNLREDSNTAYSRNSQPQTVGPLPGEKIQVRCYADKSVSFDFYAPTWANVDVGSVWNPDGTQNQDAVNKCFAATTDQDMADFIESFQLTYADGVGPLLEAIPVAVPRLTAYFWTQCHRCDFVFITNRDPQTALNCQNCGARTVTIPFGKTVAFLNELLGLVETFCHNNDWYESCYGGVHNPQKNTPDDESDEEDEWEDEEEVEGAT